MIITSNRTREVHDALKRRCLYHWIDYPTFQKEYQIVVTKRRRSQPSSPGRSAGSSRGCGSRISTSCLALPRRLIGPALCGAGRDLARRRLVVDTLGALLKYQDDIQKIRAGNVEPHGGVGPCS